MSHDRRDKRDGKRWDGKRWDAERLDGKRWDAERLDGKRWDAERLDGKRWDAERLDGKRWDGKRWDEPAAERAPRPPAGPAAAARMGFSAEEYDRAASWYEFAWERHVRAGRPGIPGRLAPDTRTAFLRPFGTEAEAFLGERCQADLDPCLVRAADALTAAATAVGELEHWPARQVSIGKETTTVQRAHLEATELSRRVNRETAVGFTHHARPGTIWKYVANLLLFVDLLAIVVIFSEILNIDYRNPTAAPGETLAAFVLPIVLLVAQFWLATGTGRRYNERREAAGTDAREEAVRQGRRWAAVLALVTVLPLTIFLVGRLLQISDDADLGTTWAMVLLVLAVAIGLAAPVVKVGVVAVDGSTASRRRDAIGVLLRRERRRFDDRLAETLAWLDDARREHDNYRSRLRPDVVHGAREPLGTAMNALSLLNAMLDPDSSIVPPPRPARPRPAQPRPAQPRPGPPRPTVDAPDPAEAGLLLPSPRWELDDIPDIDDSTLVQRDRTYLAQVRTEAGLRDRLVRPRAAPGADHGELPTPAMSAPAMSTPAKSTPAKSVVSTNWSTGAAWPAGRSPGVEEVAS